MKLDPDSLWCVLSFLGPGNLAYVRRVCHQWNELISTRLNSKCVIEPWMLEYNSRFHKDMLYIKSGFIGYTFRMIAYIDRRELAFHMYEKCVLSRQYTHISKCDAIFIRYLATMSQLDLLNKPPSEYANVIPIDKVFNRYFKKLLKNNVNPETILEFISEWKYNRVMMKRLYSSDFTNAELRMWLYLYVRLGLIGVIREAIRYGFANQLKFRLRNNRYVINTVNRQTITTDDIANYMKYDRYDNLKLMILWKYECSFGIDDVNCDYYELFARVITRELFVWAFNDDLFMKRLRDSVRLHFEI